MKKKWLISILICITIMAIFEISVNAENNNIEISHIDMIKGNNSEQIKDISENTKKINIAVENLKSENEILKDLDVQQFVEDMINNKDISDNKNKIVKAAKQILLKEISDVLKLMSVIIIIAIVCSLLKQLQDAFDNNKISNIAYFTCFASMIVVISKSFYLSIQVANTSITSISNFMYALVPIMIVLFATLGNVTQSVFMDPVLISTINICIIIISKIIFPLITFSFVLSFVNNLSDDYKISKLSSLIKKSVLWIQGIMMTSFVTMLTIRSIASATIDDVTMKTAKFAVDTAIPIVGKSLSDAISTVAGYTLLLKNSIGTIGMIVIILIMVAPIIKLFCISGIYKVTGALLQPISDKKLADCVDSVGSCITLIMSCVICITVMCFIMVAILTASGKGVISV